MTPEPNDTTLESWKEIAAYLKRDVTTVRRWEKTEGLPVHRHLHESRASVFANRAELDAWLAGRTTAERAPAAYRPRRVVRFAALAAALVLAGAASGDGGPARLDAAVMAQGIMARQLWAGRAVDTTGDVAPDGRTLSYVDWDTGDLALRDLVSGQSRRLTNKGPWSESFEFALNSVFSPDGRQLAYAWFTTGMTWELRVLSPDGGAHRTVRATKGEGYIPYAWSPDGASILTLVTHDDNTNQIALISAADGSARVLKSTDWRSPLRPVFSADGRHILLDFPPSASSSQRDIFLMAADGTSEVPIASHAANDFLPIWTPDGQSVVFLSNRAGNVGLWTIPVAGRRAAGEPRMLKADMGRVSMMKFDSTGSLHYALETGITDVFMSAIDIAAGLVLEPPAAISQTFVGANRGADWSPDGTQIAYLSERIAGPAGARNPALIVRSIATGSELTHHPGLNRIGRPRWSRDGRRLLVFAHDANGTRGMFGVDARTGAASLLFPLEGESYVPMPAWSADGGAVFYTYPKDGTFLVHMRTIGSGAARVIHRASNAHNLAPSPDGTLLAFTYPSNPDDHTESSLAVLPLAGGAPRSVVTLREPDAFALDSVNWSKDGRYLLYVTRHLKGQPNTVWRVPAAGGDPQQLHLRMEGTNVGLRLHPDGRRIAFTSGERSSEIWVLENLLPSRR